MGSLAALVSVALAAHAVILNQYPLREGCEAGDRVVAHLSEGDPVEIRFALAGDGGTCYKVTVRSGDRTLQGYVSAEAITGVDEFEQARRNAPSANLPPMVRADVDSIRKAARGRDYQDPGWKAARLLDQNRPNEALDVLQAALRAERRDAGLLSLAGYAAYRSDDMRQAMGYWKESLALRPSAAVERMYETAEREASEDKSGERLVGMRFLLRYNREQMDAATAREVVNMLDQEFARVSAQLGCRTEERIVAIAQSAEEYHKTTDAAEWSGGQYNGRIRVALMDQSRLGEKTRRSFSHEIVHACLVGLGDYPVWLHEGLAQKLAGETLTPSRLAMVKRLARSGQLPKLEKLSQTWSRMSSFHAAAAYSAALAAVDLFYEHHGGLGVRNLLRNPHLLPQITEDLDGRLRQ